MSRKVSTNTQWMVTCGPIAMAANAQGLPDLAAACPTRTMPGRTSAARLAALREYLLHIVGDEETLEMLLGHFGGFTSCADLAEPIEVDRSTVWRRLQRFLADLRKIAVLAETTVKALDCQPCVYAVWPHDATVLPPFDFWVVPVGGDQLQLPYKPALKDFCSYIRQHQDALFGRDELYLGVWLDASGSYCLTVARVFVEKAAAVSCARLNRQSCIVHLESGRILSLDDEDRRVA